MIAISIGWDCMPAVIACNTNIRKTKEQGYLTCPFDLCITNYEGVIDCINDDFKYFTDSNYLKLVRSTENILSIKNGDLLLVNTKYKFIFNHESPDHANLHITENWKNGMNHFIENDFFEFKKRYNNRIQNFRNYLNSNEHILFLYSKENTDTSKLSNVLQKLYPNLDFSFKYYYTVTVPYIRSMFKVFFLDCNK